MNPRSAVRRVWTLSDLDFLQCAQAERTQVDVC